MSFLQNLSKKAETARLLDHHYDYSALKATNLPIVGFDDGTIDLSQMLFETLLSNKRALHISY